MNLKTTIEPGIFTLYIFHTHIVYCLGHELPDMLVPICMLPSQVLNEPF
jgi:hypothetical protein